MKGVVLTIALVVSLSAAASEPGQPLDCSDWVFLEPGLSCSLFTKECDDPLQPVPNDLLCEWDHLGDRPGAVMDNDGQLYSIRTTSETGPGNCGTIRFHELRRHTALGEVRIGYLRNRCADEVSGTQDEASVLNSLRFDEERGRFLLPMRTFCTPSNCYQSDWSIIAIEGFTTTFEILQTYNPTIAELSFRVPYMPEGLPAADYFDTYYGPLATVGDWSQAQPLACGYPASAPAVGDYLTVADTTPTPAPGQGFYFVTAVTHAGERRYGRKASGGAVSGRDPSVLPGCD